MSVDPDRRRPAKRKRASSTSSASDGDGALPTPPSHDPPAIRHKILSRAQHVLTTEAAALCWTSNLYQTSTVAMDGLTDAVQAVLGAQSSGGKLIVCGVGKSAYIGMKLVATCKSLGIAASFLHACEAVHGDLGDVRPFDVVLFVSFSGKTPELMNALEHLPQETQVMAMSAHLDAEKCLLLKDRPNSILLPAPVPEPEETSFGVCAPTTSTTVALAVADMLALTVVDQLHGSDTKQVFKRNHPGGAIGINNRRQTEVCAVIDEKADVKIEVLELPSPSISAESDS